MFLIQTIFFVWLKNRHNRKRHHTVRKSFYGITEFRIQKLHQVCYIKREKAFSSRGFYFFIPPKSKRVSYIRVTHLQQGSPAGMSAVYLGDGASLELLELGSSHQLYKNVRRLDRITSDLIGSPM